MKKIFSLALAAVAVLAATSCNKLEPLTSENFTCDPSPLVEVGGAVDATITVTYPEKYFKKKATVDVTPVLVYANGEAKSETLTYQGEKVKGNDETVSYKYGGTLTFKAHFDYVPDMAKSELYIEYVGHIGKKDFTFERIKIADGVVATETMATADEATPAYAADQFVKDTFDKYFAKVIYQYQSTSLRNSETNKEEMKNVQNMIKNTKNEERREFEGIEMISTASPEGAVSLNEKLAAGREKASSNYLQNFFKKAKMEGSITPTQIAEDWEGFKELVQNSNIQDKQLVLNVLGRISNPDQRETEIKNLSAAYKELSDEILPQLRYSKVAATIKNIGHSDEEILGLISSNPDSLTLEELLYAATLQKEDELKLNAYRIATNRFPEDVRALNNTAGIYFNQGKFAEAKKAWEGVVAKDAANAQANLNLGLIALHDGDLAAAESYFGKGGSCEEYGEAYGTLLVRQGKYAQAIKSFGDKKCNNLAVAQICSNKYSDAKATLEAVEAKNATTYYLLAVVAARTNNAAAVESNLKEAVKLNADLKAKAANDAEFAKYASAVAAL
ncbi:MAG: tetratricopeptide repeat protein [Bacteroidales bacterium]|jgi:molybdopterin converting factor small subunit|nr:tetratricopeptide repeat protein [Bacteroidales bacterium]